MALSKNSADHLNTNHPISTFIAFDLETTGFLAGVDQIIEIGALRFVHGKPDAVFSTLVNPGIPIPPGASKVNGITDDMVQGKPSIESLLSPFAKFCGGSALVAHNAPFDAQFLTAAIKQHCSPAPRGIVLDTLPMARKIFPGLSNYKLGTLVQHLSIKTTKFHRAEEDASYCGQLFIKIIDRMINQSHKAPSLDHCIAMTGKPALKFPHIEPVPKQLELNL